MRLLLIATILLAPAALPAQEPHRPNILIILTDDQRFDAMGCAGHPFLKTPNIDRIAKAGVRFRNAFATTPICAASRASIFTGLYERTHKFTFGTPPLAARYCDISYATLLKLAGYRTGLIGKFGVNVPADQKKAMFDVFENIGSPFMRNLPSSERRHIDQIATDKAIAFLKDQDRGKPSYGKPFCLSLSFNSPHAEDFKIDRLYPWPSTVDGLYEDAPIPAPPLVEEKWFDELPRFMRNSLGRKRWLWQFDTTENYERNVRAYDRMISGIDHEIGRLFAELEKLGLADNTIVVFMADNGYFLGERGLSGKWNHFEESIRVPLLIADPRTPAEQRGRARDDMVLNIDIAPTLLDFAGLVATKDHQGLSLTPLLRGETPKDWRIDFFAEHLFAHPDLPKWEGVRGERYVYARYFEQKPPYEFLHDLKNDPRETKNLRDDSAHAKTLETMRRRCDELQQRYGGPYSRERFPTIGGKK